jgi:small acid-soluble spore protein E (minor gamma-type SASP)
MAKRSKAGTNVEKVRQQNQAAQAGLSDTEFASETDAAAVRQANQQSQNKQKNKNK